MNQTKGEIKNCFPKAITCDVGPWLWSSGQRVCLLLRRSEFESHWRLQFFSVKFVFEKNENKPEKRPGLNHLKKHWQCDTISGLGTASLACFFCNLKTSFNVCGCGTIAGWPVICNLVNEFFASNSYSQLYREQQFKSKGPIQF